MARLKIRIYGDEVLRKKNRYVKQFDEKLKKLVDEMFEFMYEYQGIGLAAPQVGISKRLFVVDTLEEGEKIALANPKIVWKSNETVTMKEGCLSIPEVEGEVVRSERIRVKAQDPYTGDDLEFYAEGLFARVIQHENDHLHGILFIDHLSEADRSSIDRKLQELAAA